MAKATSKKATSKNEDIKETVQPQPIVETRGRKPKELSIEDVANQAKELVLTIRAYIKIKQAAGKNSMRLHSAAIDIERLLRTHLID